MNWETPELVEIDMSAEIGAYQSDFAPFDGTPAPFERAPAPDCSREAGSASAPA